MAEKRVGNRSSEGVVAIRHPRTDFPQQGWIRKPTGTLYEAYTGFGWFTQTQSYRPNENIKGYRTRQRSVRPFYQTEPQQGWIRKPTGTLYEAYTDFGWFTQTQTTGRTPKHPARSLDNWDQDDQNFDIISVSQAFDPATQDWHIDTARTSQRLGRFLRNTNTDVSWIFPNLPAAFDPATQNWLQQTDRTAKGPRYQRDTNTDTSWIFPTLPAAFDPSTYPWTVQSDRPSRGRPSYRLLRTGATGFGTPFDPINFDWTQQPGERTRPSPTLVVQRYQSFYDLSWVHDVIPLTDPVPGTVLHLRPIAPIMSARRRNKRR